MKIKKIFAGIAACAVAAVSMALVVSADVAGTLPAGEGTQKWMMGSDTDTPLDLATVGSKDVTKITSVVINLTMTSTNQPYGNAQLFSNADGSGWKSTRVGVQSGVDVVFEEGVAKDVTLDLTTAGWYQIGIEEYGGGAWSINSVTFMAGSDVYYAYPSAASNDDTTTTTPAATTVTTTAAGGSSGSADTGVEDLAVVSSIIVAAGAVAFAAKKKR